MTKYYWSIIKEGDLQKIVEYGLQYHSEAEFNAELIGELGFDLALMPEKKNKKEVKNA